MGDSHIRPSDSPVGSADSGVRPRARVEDEILALTRLYAFLSTVNRTIIRCEDASLLLKGVCDAAVQHGGFLGACVWMRRPRSGELRSAARRCGRKCPKKLGAAGELLLDEAAVEALESGRHVFLEDSGNGDSPRPALTPCRTDGEATMVFPLRNGARLVGTFGVCAYSRRLFGFRELGLLDEVAGDLSFALATLDLKAYRERADRKLRVYQQMLRDAADIVLLLRESDGRVLEANEAATRTYGYTLRELRTKRIADLRAPDERDRYEEQLRTALEEGSLYETVHERKDGTRFPVEVGLRRSSIGDAHVIVSVLRDISERRQVERLKDDLLSMVSHELRTPLAVILGNALLLQRMDPEEDPGRFAAALEAIRRRGEGMTFLVEDLLEGSVIRGKGLRLVPVGCDVGALVRDAANSVPLGERHQLAVEAPEGVVVRWDPQRMSQVLRNLLSNAAKFSPRGGVIGIRAYAEDGWVAIEVTDEGVGIADEDLPRVFEKFFQADMSQTRSFGGVGMGLFLAHEIVERHGGRIEVRSRKGKGTTFRVLLPVELPLGEGVAR